MQVRTEDNRILIRCDFTGEDWDQVSPMIEGHRGSVISLAALAQAIEQAGPDDVPFQCTMCLRDYQAGEKAWRHPLPAPTANPDAVICWDCIRQADRAFDRDPQTDWSRRIPADRRWR